MFFKTWKSLMKRRLGVQMVFQSQDCSKVVEIHSVCFFVSDWKDCINPLVKSLFIDFFQLNF